MTTFVLLWWNNIHNKLWIQEVEKELLPLYNTTHIHNYRHRDEWGNMDIEYECKQLYTYLKTVTWSIILFCKSLWCLLAVKTMVEKGILIKQCIFVWFPLWFTEHHSFPIEEYLKKIVCPILRIQHTNDPAWGYTTIAEGVWRLSAAFICKEISGDTHDYPEVKILKQVILDTNAK